MKVVLFHRQWTEYRQPVYRALERMEGLEVRFCFDLPPCPADAPSKVIAGNPLGLWWNWRHERKIGIYFSPGLIMELLRFRPQVILSEDGSNVVNNAILVALRSIIGCRLVLWGLGNIPGRKVSPYKRLAWPLIRFLWRQADAIVSYSSYGARFYTSNGAKPAKVFIAANALELGDVATRMSEVRLGTELADLLRGRRLVLYLGRLVATKRPRDVIDVARRFHAAGHNDVVFLIVGSGPERPRLEQEIELEGLPNCKVLRGVSLEAATKYLRWAEVCVVPGEGGLVYNHALAHGVPVVATGGDGTEFDLIADGVNGRLVERADLEALTSAVREVLAHPHYKHHAAATAGKLPTIAGLAVALQAALTYACRAQSAPTACDSVNNR